jgi:hypothetical protein
MGPRDPRNGLTPARFEARASGSLGPGIIGLGVVFYLPPISQDLEYHSSANDRTMCGVANPPNVASNLSYLVVGSLGLALLPRPGNSGRSGPLLALYRPFEFTPPGRVTGDAPERAR